MKKFYLTFFICFVAYAIGIVIYFYSAPTTVPPSYQGGPADPTTFMSKEQLYQAHSYSLISYLTYFLEFPLDWLLLISIMGWSVRLRHFVEKITRFFFIQILMYAFLFNLFHLVIHLPISLAYFILDHRYGLSNEPMGVWIGDIAKNFALNLVITVPMVWLAYRVIRKSPRRWWIWTWFLLAPVITLMVFIKPIMIDPIFNDFIPLQNQELKHDILALAGKAKIPTHEVFR
jgi:STE24 endopeptidase